MGSLDRWWAALSGESKAAIIAAIIGPIAAEILGIRIRIIRWTYIRTLEKLDRAKERLDRTLSDGLWPKGNIIPLEDSQFPFPFEMVAREAKVWLWLARRATRWQERAKKYGV